MLDELLDAFDRTFTGQEANYSSVALTITTFWFLNQQFLSPVCFMVTFIHLRHVPAQANNDRAFVGNVGCDVGRNVGYVSPPPHKLRRTFEYF